MPDRPVANALRVAAVIVFKKLTRHIGLDGVEIRADGRQHLKDGGGDRCKWTDPEFRFAARRGSHGRQSRGHWYVGHGPAEKSSWGLRIRRLSMGEFGDGEGETR